MTKIKTLITVAKTNTGENTPKIRKKINLMCPYDMELLNSIWACKKCGRKYNMVNSPVITVDIKKTKEPYRDQILSLV